MDYSVNDSVIVLDPTYGKMVGRIVGVYDHCVVVEGPRLDSRVMQFTVQRTHFHEYLRPYRPYIPRHAR